MKFLLVLFIGFVLFACSSSEKQDASLLKEESLPFLGNFGEDHVIPNIRFLNQDSVWKTSEDYFGKIWVSEFFFSTCPTICPIMNGQMNILAEEFKELDSIVQFLSFTINPSYDSPGVLKSYRDQHGYAFKNWDFLTGVDEKRVHELGVDYFLVHAGKGTEEEGGYAHSGAFTLVDVLGHVRGVYQMTDGEGERDDQELNRLRKDLKILIKDEFNVQH
jgi:protein SCO1/2